MIVSKNKSKAWTATQIATLRKSLGLLQKEAAAKLRVSQALWADWERGHRSPSPSHKLLLNMMEAGQLPADES